MTGGIGFSKWAQNNNQQNLSKLKKRKRQEDNPYGPSQPNYKRNFQNNFQELMLWKENKARKDRRLKLIVVGTIIIVFAVTILIFSI